MTGWLVRTLVLFAYSRKHDSAAGDKMLGDYRGTLVLDAHTVYGYDRDRSPGP